MATSDAPSSLFSPEVRALCAAGPTFFDLPWRDYVREFKLSPRHILELLQIVNAWRQGGDGGEIGDWAELHARRALGELRAVDAIEPLIALSEVDDGAVLDLPIVAGLIGPSAIPHLMHSLRTRVVDDPTVQIVAIEALVLIARWHNDARRDVAKILCDQLQNYPMQPGIINGTLIAGLELLSPSTCRETIDSIRRLYIYHIDCNLRAYPSTRKDVVKSI